jgi:hypothetical protein
MQPTPAYASTSKSTFLPFPSTSNPISNVSNPQNKSYEILLFFSSSEILAGSVGKAFFSGSLQLTLQPPDLGKLTSSFPNTPHYSPPDATFPSFPSFASLRQSWPLTDPLTLFAYKIAVPCSMGRDFFGSHGDSNLIQREGGNDGVSAPIRQSRGVGGQGRTSI